MVKQTSQEALNSLVRSVALFPEGASLEQIVCSLSTPIPLRTAQRRIAALIKKGIVHTQGKARSQRYFLTNTVESHKNDLIPLSSPALSIQDKMCQPIQARTPVGYDRKFLDSYRPNVSSYLSQETQKHLYTIGKTPNGEKPAGTYAKKIFNRLLIDLSWNSSRLEGNTYSLLETTRLLELGEASEGKDVKEAQMILNHKAAIEFLVDMADHIDVNQYTLLNLHALLSQNLLPDSRNCGRLRSIPVGIAKSVYHPLEVPQLIQECFTQILDTGKSIINPFEQAFFLMVHIPYLQPFDDVNKRLSRLAANIPLIRSNMCPLSFVDVPEDLYTNSVLGVYELNKIDFLRDVFVWAYERSCALYAATKMAFGDPDPFRLRYRDAIQDTILHIVTSKMDQKTALSYIKQRAMDLIPGSEQAKFTTVIETELMSLHEGNIARYRIPLPSYQTFKKNWDKVNIR